MKQNVCMYVRMYVCMYVCMYVRMYAYVALGKTAHSQKSAHPLLLAQIHV